MMRWVELESSRNFRDLGGYPTTLGTTTRWRVLYRSGSLDRSTDGDLAAVARLGVRTVFDLRTADEREAIAPWHDLVDVVHLPVANPATATFALGRYDPAARYIERIAELAPPFAEILRALADHQRLPAVISCSGGKDRTGMTVALLLQTLRVERDAISADYALTDEFAERDPVAYEVARQRVESNGWDPEVLRSRPATIDRFLEVERTRPVEALARSAGVTADELERVRINLTEA